MNKGITLEYARRVVPKPLGTAKVVHADGITEDIINTMVSNFKKNFFPGGTKTLALALKGGTPEITLRKVWAFVRREIRYQIDPPGKQFIKSPRAIINDGFGDCKAYAILTNNLLLHLGFKPYFRFVSFKEGSQQVTHVYTVVNTGGRPFILDSCLQRFNHEKPYTFKRDIMAEISVISGMNAVGVGNINLPENRDVNEGEMDLRIALANAELERSIAGAIHGIGSPVERALEEVESDYRAAVAAIGNPEGLEEVASAIGRRGKRKAKRKAKKTARKQKRRVTRQKRRQRRKRLIKRAVKLAKRGVKAFAKVATFPQRMFVKALAQVFLPRFAQFFLYLFITNQQTINSLPAKVKRKRKKAELFAKFMTRVIGMKQSHFMGLVRRGIMKQRGRTPEQILTAMVKGKPISGIGVAPVALAMLPQILDVIGKIAKLFGKKPGADETPSADDFPSEDDFEEADQTTRAMVETNQRFKPTPFKGMEPATPSEFAEELQMEEQAMQKVQANEGTAVPTMDEIDPGEGGDFNQPASADGNGGGQEAEPTRQEGEAEPGEKKSSILPLLALGAAGFMLTNKKK